MESLYELISLGPNYPFSFDNPLIFDLIYTILPIFTPYK